MYRANEQEAKEQMEKDIKAKSKFVGKWVVPDCDWLYLDFINHYTLDDGVSICDYYYDDHYIYTSDPKGNYEPLERRYELSNDGKKLTLYREDWEDTYAKVSE